MDVDLGMVYLPVEASTGDYYGGYRPGDNLFAESLVAVDLYTGERRWHFQLVHHGIWDHDIPCAPILLDLMIDGELVKAVAQPTKQAFLYVFNRETGEPIWPIEERPVEAGDVPGEWYSPTQPFPTKPPGYDRQGVTLDDLIDFTPELRAEAVEHAAFFKLGPIFTPPVVSQLDGPIGTLMAPPQGGGTNWPGGSYDPETRILYVSSNSSLGLLSIVPPYPGQSDMDYIQGNAVAGPRTSGGAGSSAGGGRTEFEVPPRPRLTAEAAPARPPHHPGAAAAQAAVRHHRGHRYGPRGDPVADSARGDAGQRPQPPGVCRGLDIPRTGQRGSVGTLVTRTLLIAGDPGTHTLPSGERGAMLRAYDKATGDEVGTVYPAGAAVRVADDLRARRRAVPGGRGQRRRLFGGADRVPAAGVARGPARYVVRRLHGAWRGRTVGLFRALDHDLRAVRSLAEHGRVAFYRAEDVDRARRPDLVAAAHRGRSPEEAEGAARRPVRHCALVDGRLRESAASAASTGIEK